MAALRIAFLTHEPFYPPSGGGSAEAIYLVEEMRRRGHEVHVFCPTIPDAKTVETKFGIRLHLFNRWPMGRYARLRNFKYVVYPFFLQRMVAAAARTLKFDCVFSQHAISAVAAGKLKARLKLPVVMNFPDLLTGFMDTWPSYVAPKPLVGALKRYELSLPTRYGVDGVLTVSDTLADRFAKTGFPRDRLQPIYYGYDAKYFLFHGSRASKQPPVIVMHGSFDAHHLGEIAFQAARYVTQRRPGTVFRFIGRRTGSLENLLSRAAQGIPGFKAETPGFVPYSDVAKHLDDASVGIVPYEESDGTHCAFVAKAVEYVAVGLPAVCTPIQSIATYFKDDPMVKFSAFDGEDFGRKILATFDELPGSGEIAAKSAARVQAELDWQPLCRKAIDATERFVATAV